MIAGRRIGDPYTAAPPTRPFADEVGADPGRLRIGLAPTHAGVETDSECAAAVEAAGALLEGLGHDVEVAQPDAFFDDEFSRPFVTIVAVATAVDYANMGEAIGRPIAEGDVEASNWSWGRSEQRCQPPTTSHRSTGCTLGRGGCTPGGTTSTCSSAP